MKKNLLHTLKHILKKIPLVRRTWHGMKARLAYRIVMNRKIDREALTQWRRILKYKPDGFIPLVGNLLNTPEFKDMLLYYPSVDSLPWNYHYVLHHARMELVKSLPAAKHIIDLGGACPQDRRGSMIYMGYAQPFTTLTIVDLPPDQSIEQRGARMIDDPIETDQGTIRYRYLNMRDVVQRDLPAASLDLIWMGQSLEHISEPEFDVILQWAKTVLRENGLLVCDTPNRRVTRVQCPDGYIHGEHQREYEYAELVDKFKRAGFRITRQGGIGLCRKALARGRFDEEEIVAHPGLNDIPNDSYLIYFFLQL